MYKKDELTINEQGALFGDLGTCPVVVCNIIMGYWFVGRLDYCPLAKSQQKYHVILDLCFYLALPSRPYHFLLSSWYYFQMIRHKQNVVSFNQNLLLLLHLSALENCVFSLIHIFYFNIYNFNSFYLFIFLLYFSLQNVSGA